jgi:hypothetical protein
VIAANDCGVFARGKSLDRCGEYEGASVSCDVGYVPMLLAPNPFWSYDGDALENQKLFALMAISGFGAFVISKIISVLEVVIPSTPMPAAGAQNCWVDCRIPPAVQEQFQS